MAEDVAGPTSDRIPSRIPTLVLVAAVVVILAGLKAASSIVVPILLGAFIAILIDTGVRYLARYRIPFLPAVILLIALICLLAIGISITVGASLQRFLNELPQYGDMLRQRETELLRHLESYGLAVSDIKIPSIFEPQTLTNWLAGFLKGLLNVFSNAFVILLIVIFILAEGAQFPHKIRAAFPGSIDTMTAAGEIIDNVRRYVAIKTFISALTGILVTVALIALNVPYPLLWGFLTFLLNYVPTIGSLIAAIPAVALALLVNGIGNAIWVGIAYLAVNQLLGSIIEPRLQGKGLGLSTLVVFVSLLFWGWIFGPVGVFLSAPLTMVIRIACRDSRRLQPIAIFLGSGKSIRGT